MAASVLLRPLARRGGGQWALPEAGKPEAGEPDYQRALAANQGGCGRPVDEACYNRGLWSPPVAKLCPHTRTRLIAQDDAATYLECLDCGELFEPAELDRPAPAAPDFDEDLSDA